MIHVLFTINPPYTLQKALEELFSCGLEHHYFIEEEGLSDKIGGFLTTLPPELRYCTLIEHSEGIDWDKEWKMHSPYYKEGLLEIDLNDFGADLLDSKIYLEPGPGFGDLSHPTTYLMLNTMSHYIKGKDIIDIGCGSGILSLAAHKMNATSVTGLDIEDEALEHSRKNALLNNMHGLKFQKHLSAESSNSVFLINMTFYEQKNVFAQYLNLKGTFIISGLLKEQKDTYLKNFPYSSNPPIASFEKDGWIGIVLSSLN